VIVRPVEDTEFSPVRLNSENGSSSGDGRVLPAANTPYVLRRGFL
jgi:hypothetical protein